MSSEKKITMYSYLFCIVGCVISLWMIFSTRYIACVFNAIGFVFMAISNGLLEKEETGNHNLEKVGMCNKITIILFMGAFLFNVLQIRF